ncbi:MAG: cytochrome P450 [Chloroflexota bacterium]|nr:cytochrome P450 [Chloroflexota bacterium]
MPVIIDFDDPAHAADPYALYRKMREEAPVYLDTQDRTWYLTRYRDVYAALHDPRLSADRTDAQMRQLPAEARGQFRAYELARRAMLLFVDPPAHVRLRRLVAKAFTPSAVAALRPRIQSIVDTVLDDVATQDGFDVIRDLAFPVPLMVIAEMLGVPLADRMRIKVWSSDFTRALFGSFTPDVAARAEQAVIGLADELRPTVARLRDHPDGSVLGRLVLAEEPGDRLSEAELYATCMLLLIAGHETTVNLIGNGLLLLLQQHSAAERRGDAATIEPTIEEILRYEPSVPFTVRVAAEDFQIDGQQIQRGEPVCLYLAAANRDPAIFTDPERFDTARNPNPHLAFGQGMHICLGAALARAEGQIAIKTILQRFPQLRLSSGAPDWLPAGAGRALRSLPVALTAPEPSQFIR